MVRGRHYGTGLMVSVFLHLALLAWLLPAAFTPASMTERAPGMEVSLVFVRPARDPLPAPAPEVPDSGASVVQNVEAPGVDTPEIVQAPAVTRSTALLDNPIDTANGSPTMPEQPEATVAQEPATVPHEGLDAAGVRAAVTAFVQQQEGARTADFVEDCWLQRQEHGPSRGCEGVRDSDRGGSALALDQVDGLFLALTREQRHVRLRAQFELRNLQLRALQEQGGTAGELATSLGALNREYLAYLNGNRNEAAHRYVMSAATGDANPVGMDSFLQFTCAKMPCIYEFTGFSIKQPQSQEPAAADTWRRMPTPFAPRR